MRRCYELVKVLFMLLGLFNSLFVLLTVVCGEAGAAWCCVWSVLVQPWLVMIGGWQKQEHGSWTPAGDNLWWQNHG